MKKKRDIIVLVKLKKELLPWDLHNEKFGRLVGAELKTIKSNIIQVYNDDTLLEINDQDLEPSDIGFIFWFLIVNIADQILLSYFPISKYLDSPIVKDFVHELSAHWRTRIGPRITRIITN